MGCAHLSSLKHKCLYILPTLTYIFNYNSDHNRPQTEKMPEEEFGHYDQIHDAKTELIQLSEQKDGWQLTPTYHLLSILKSHLDKLPSSHSNYGQWIVAVEPTDETKAASRYRLYPTFEDILHRFRRSKSISRVYVCQIGNDDDVMGPLPVIYMGTATKELTHLIPPVEDRVPQTIKLDDDEPRVLEETVRELVPI